MFLFNETLTHHHGFWTMAEGLVFCGILLLIVLIFLGLCCFCFGDSEKAENVSLLVQKGLNPDAIVIYTPSSKKQAPSMETAEKEVPRRATVIEIPEPSSQESSKKPSLHELLVNDPLVTF